jgi:hypothetical protein
MAIRMDMAIPTVGIQRHTSALDFMGDTAGTADSAASGDKRIILQKSYRGLGTPFKFHGVSKPHF